MRRTIFMLPRADGFNSGLDRWPNASPYGGAPQISLWEAWRDADYNDLGEVAPPYCINDTAPFCDYAVLIRDRVNGSGAAGMVFFEPPPTLVFYTRVKFHCWIDYSGEGANNWFFPPDNAHGPQAAFILMKRDHVTPLAIGPTFEVGYDGATGSPVGDRYCNVNQPACGAGYVGPIHMEYETFSHPEAGPWTQDDMVTLQAGISMSVAGPGWDPSQRFPKFRAFHFYVECDVQDLGGFVRNVRHSASLDARLFRRARNQVSMRVPDTSADRTIGSKFYASHPKGPSIGVAGWGERRLERRPLLLLQRQYWPEQVKVIETAYDLHEYQALLWGAFRIDSAWTPELTGLSYFDQGGDFGVTRAQDGWSPRPGDGVLMRCLEHYALLSFEGLACQGGGDVARSHWNFNPGTTSGPGNLWTAISFTGGTSAVDDVGTTVVEELGYTLSAHVTFSPAPGTGGYEQSLGTVSNAGGNLFNIRVVVRNINVDTPASKFMEYVLRRNGTRAAVPFTEYLDFATGTWGAVIVYNPIGADMPYGELIGDGISLDDPTADGAITYLHRVGRFSSAIADAEYILALTDVQLGGTPNGASYGTRTPLVTSGADITRTAMHFQIANSNPAKRSYFTDRGMVIAEFRPWFKSALMPNGTVKPIVVARHTATDVDRLEFVRAAGANKIRFRREWLAGTKDVEIAIPDVSRAHVIRVWCRWLEDEGWDQYAPRTLQVGWARFLHATDAFIDEDSALAENQSGTLAATDWIRVGSDDAPNYLDGWLRMVEVLRNPISGDEAVWKR